MTILNLTQHIATQEQIAAGVVEPTSAIKTEIIEHLNFTKMPYFYEIVDKARHLAYIAALNGYTKALIGGAPYLMGPLEKTLKENGVTPMYSFTQRVSEEKLVDGNVVKTNVFKHVGFVTASI